MVDVLFPRFLQELDAQTLIRKHGASEKQNYPVRTRWVEKKKCERYENKILSPPVCKSMVGDNVFK